MAFPTSDLSAQNVLRDVHDPATQTLRTSATAVIAPGLEVDISHTDDSIRLGNGTNLITATIDTGKVGLDVNVINDIPLTATDLDIRDLNASQDNVAISDGTDTLSINADGSINAQVSGTVTIIPSGTQTETYNEITAVANSTLTVIATYNVVGSRLLKQVNVSGTNIAAYSVVVNGNTVMKLRTHFGNLNQDFLFSSAKALSNGDVVEVKVIHDRPSLGDFNTTIFTENG